MISRPVIEHVRPGRRSVDDLESLRSCLPMLLRPRRAAPPRRGRARSGSSRCARRRPLRASTDRSRRWISSAFASGSVGSSCLSRADVLERGSSCTASRCACAVLRVQPAGGGVRAVVDDLHLELRGARDQLLGLHDRRAVRVAGQLDDDVVALLDDARLGDALLVDALADRRDRVASARVFLSRRRSPSTRGSRARSVVGSAASQRARSSTSCRCSRSRSSASMSPTLGGVGRAAR